MKRGVFDALTMYIAAGFDANHDIALRLNKCFNEGGVLIMNEADKKNIESRMKNESNSLKKYHAFLSYLMEFGYDLAIAPSYNVSDSFGFEGFVATFHNNA